METLGVHSDEPTAKDLLSRDLYASALAEMAEHCETPLVIGIYGTWGVGKTSLMQQIKGKLEAQDKTKQVWFNPWQHQFDDEPALALLHAAVYFLGENNREELKGALKALGLALGSFALKKAFNHTTNDIKKIIDDFAEEQFLTHERQIQIRQKFIKIIDTIRGNKNKRVVFFIDDLDRCMPPQILSVLESLKLHLNLPGCVYFVGLDRDPIEQSIKHHYQSLDMSEADYLDKIIQLPFTIPPIEQSSLREFIANIIPSMLKSCLDVLLIGLDNNPRQVKRFINVLILNHLMAIKLNINNYDPRILSFVLIIQNLDRPLYKAISHDPEIMNDLKLHGGNKELRDQYIGSSQWFDQILQYLEEKKLIQHHADLERYLYLTEHSGSESLGDILGPAIRAAQAQKTVQDKSKFGPRKGTVKWFNLAKGYGFLQPDDGNSDDFVHIAAVERAGLDSLQEGQMVEYELVPGRNGKFSAENLVVHSLERHR